jgi:vitamin B12 transporter
VFGAVNNIFNVDDHPLFIALNDSPFVSDPRGSNGARGNSIPGREFILGAQVRF